MCIINVYGNTIFESVKFFKSWFEKYIFVVILSDNFRVTMSFGHLNYINWKSEIIDTEKENNFSSFDTNFNLSTVYFGFEFKF